MRKYSNGRQIRLGATTNSNNFSWRERDPEFISNVCTHFLHCRCRDVLWIKDESLHIKMTGTTDHAEVEKRSLDQDSSSVSTMVSKKRKIDATPGNDGESAQQKVDPSELASAFALASLAGFGLKATLSTDTTKVIEQPKDKYQGSKNARVGNSLSFEETRSPEATQAPYTPDERSPGSPQSSKSSDDEPGTPDSKRVHFAPSTKEDQRPSTPTSTTKPSQMPQISRRISIPTHIQGSGSFPPPRPQGPYPYGGFNHSSFRSPPHMPHHPMHSPHGPYHHSPQPWFHSPAMAASMAGRMAYPPQRLIQPPLHHPENNEWICDFCNVASFSTFEEACIHEEACRIRCTNRMPRGYPPYGLPSPSYHHPGLHQVHSLRSRSGSIEEDIHAVPQEGAVTPANSDTWHSGAMSLAMGESDSEWLSELNCFIRVHCVEAFSANDEDVARSSKRGRIALHQVGIRCRYCADVPCKDKGVAAVSFPTSVSGIYESVKRWQRVHLEVCDSVPQEIRSKLDALSNTNVWVPTTRQYWSDSARAMGLVDTTEGIRFGIDPKEVASRVSSADGFKLPMMHKRMIMAPNAPSSPSVSRSSGPVSISHSPMIAGDTIVTSTSIDESSPPSYVVFQDDMDMIPPYVYFLMRQVEPCRFTEADRFVARSKGPVGYPGFQCRHCKGHAGLGKYFPVSAKSLSTNSTSQNIHAHILKCRKAPETVKDRLVQLKIEKGRSPRLEPGWRKIFFDKVWGRLHG